MSRKSQAQKKRHTKPCKFFQLNRCPYTTEVCDFAHVLTAPFNPPAATTLCRYYYARDCAHGASCKYRHGGSVQPLEGQEAMPDWRATSTSDITYAAASTVTERLMPYAQRWHSMSFYPSPPPFSPLSPDSLNFSPSARSRDSIQSLDTLSTSNTSLESDDVMIVTEDPQYEEHSHAHQSQICITDETPLIHVPPFYQAPFYMNTTLPRLQVGFDYAYSNLVRTKTRIGPKPVSKQKALKYKTKPCKFWSSEKGCPNGDECTFLHDDEESPNPSPISQQSFSSEQEKGGSPRKNFVPVQWRVIGGGVLVSTSKKDGHEDDNSSPIVESLPSKSDHPTVPPLKIVTRKRSNSIPPTPSITQVNMEHLFSAESPGVL